MRIVKCPKCGRDCNIDIAKAIDENGEIFQCPYCKFRFVYTE